MTEQDEFIAHLDTLNEITALLSREMEIGHALQAALAGLVDLMGLETGWIFVRDLDSRDRWAGPNFRLLAHHNLPPALSLDNPHAWDKGCDCQNLCQKGELDGAYNEVHCSRLGSVEGDRAGLTVHASAPLRSGEKTLGILNVAAPSWEALSPRALALFSNVGHQMGIALERARLMDLVQEQRVHEQVALLDLSQQLLGHLDLDDLMHYLVVEARRLLSADAAALLLANADRTVLRFRAASGWRSNPVAHAYQVPVASTGSGTVMETRKPLVWDGDDEEEPSAGAEEEMPMLTWLREEGFRSAAIVPLIADENPIGTLVVDSRHVRSFDDEDVRFLQLMANQAAIAIEKARLRQEELERHRMEKELSVGRQIQLSMLPESCPMVPGWQFGAIYEAAKQVGGDFYDFFRVPNGEQEQWGLVIADVSDKGVPAALFMALSRTTIRNTALRGRPPAEALTWANRFIREDSQSDMFLTAFYAVLNTDNGRLTFCSAGHNRPLWWRAQEKDFQELDTDGIVLGVLDDISLAEQSVEVAPGDALLFYTDGVTEALNEEMEEFGLERLKTAVSTTLTTDPAASPDDLIDAILGAVHAFTGAADQYDDITLLVVRRDVA